MTYTTQTSFSQLSVLPFICRNLARIGWNEPSPIQNLAIPHSLQGKDVIGLAETGSGKTGAFLIPLIQNWIGAGRPTGFGLILVPTHELAHQITEVATDLGSNCEEKTAESIVVIQLIGGESLVDQALQLAWHRHHLIVATPGRLVEHISQSRDFARQQLSSIRHLVLDEADRMLNMAFSDDIDAILGLFEPVQKKKKRVRKKALLDLTPTEHLDSKKKNVLSVTKYPHPQTYLYSATMTKEVLHLKRSALSTDAVVINASGEVLPVSDSLNCSVSVNAAMKIGLPSKLSHFYLPLRLADKPALLHWLLQTDTLSRVRKLFNFPDETPVSESRPKVLVFCRRCLEAQLVARFLEVTARDHVSLLHGRAPQLERKRNIDRFISGETTILVATDVASRGLDLPNIELVINYTVPLSEKLYRHRVGRTARSGNPGIAVTLVTRDCASQFLELESTLVPYLPAQTKGIPRWPLPIPQNGMHALRRQAENAWRKAAKALRMEHGDEHLSSSDSEYSSSQSEAESELSTPSDEEGSPDLAETNTARLDLTGSAGVVAVKRSQRLRKRKRKQQTTDDSTKANRGLGWGLKDAKSTDRVTDVEQDNLAFTESLKKKYPQIQTPKRKSVH